MVAEALRREPKPGVLAWLDHHACEALFLAATCAAALLRDAARLPAWQRETERRGPVMAQAIALFENRVLPFDAAALRAYGEITDAVRQQQGSIGRKDAVTAAIAKANGLVVACRNESPFLMAGLTVTNPWRF